MAELIAASKEGDEVEAKRLLDHGADVNARNQDQETPLHKAKNEAIVNLLLDHGADVNAKDRYQFTPLHRAQSLPRRINVNVARLLINSGAQLTAVNDDGRNVLHIAAENANTPYMLGSLYMFDANADLCLFLVSRGLDPNIADNKGETALTLYGRQFDVDDPDDEDDEDEDNPPLTDEQKEEAVVELLAARESYEQRVRDEHWKKNWPLMNTLTSSGLRPMNAEVAALAAQQAASDKSVKLPGIPRITKAQNIAFLNQAVLGRENEHLFLRHIVGFIPRTRFEVEESEDEDEEGEEEEESEIEGEGEESANPM